MSSWEWECPDCGREFPIISVAEGRRINKTHNCQDNWKEALNG